MRKRVPGSQFRRQWCQALPWQSPGENFVGPRPFPVLILAIPTTSAKSRAMNRTERNRLHPLEGNRAPETSPITGLEVTLLSCEYPPEEQLLVRAQTSGGSPDSIIVPRSTPTRE